MYRTRPPGLKNAALKAKNMPNIVLIQEDQDIANMNIVENIVSEYNPSDGDIEAHPYIANCKKIASRSDDRPIKIETKANNELLDEVLFSDRDSGTYLEKSLLAIK